MGAIPPKQSEQNMTTIKLIAQSAHKTTGNCIAVLFDFKEYFPTRVVQVSNTAEAVAALDQYAKDAEATGQSLCVSMLLAKGERSPNGFKKVRPHRYVNLRAEAEV
jgi:hypothetical protein